MKVLQLITTLNTGGAEKLVADISPILKEKGIDAEVLLLKDTQTPFRAELEKNTDIKVNVLSKGHLYNPLLVFKLFPHLKKYDIIHGHLFPTSYWLVLAKWLSFSKVKIVYTEHSTNNRRRDSWFFKQVDRLIYRGMNQVITISDEVDSLLKKHLDYKNFNQFHLIQNGVDLENFTRAEAYDKSKFFGVDDFILIQVSGFRTQKDQATLIRSLMHLPEEVKLLLVGDGPLRKENEDLVNELKLENRVQFLGIRTDIPQLLQTADVAVLSSHYEGLSLASVEGMACKPFVASDVPGLREIVKDFGLVFPQGDEKALATEILKLKNDAQFYQKIKTLCSQRASEFDIQKMVAQYMEIYQSFFK